MRNILFNPALAKMNVIFNDSTEKMVITFDSIKNYPKDEIKAKLMS